MFGLAIFSSDVLSNDGETRRVLGLLKQCKVLNIALYAADKSSENSRRLGIDGCIKGSWFCPNGDEGNTIRDILAYYHIAPQDALYVGCTAPAIGKAKKTGVATFCLGEYFSPTYLHQTRPRYKVSALSEVFAVVRAQLGS